MRMIEDFNKTENREFTLNVNENADQLLGRHPHGIKTRPDMAKI